jgi:hypothetical protein
MFISGHEDVLDDIVAELGSGFFEGWPLGLGRRALMTAMKRGLAYPDLPCGKMKLSGRTVRMRNPLLCSLGKLYQLLIPGGAHGHGHTQLYQSHLGAHSFMHAMTPDPRSTVGDVARSVVEHVLSCASLASETSASPGSESRFYAMWLGVALHTMMDSYTEAHTIRHEGRDLFRPSGASRSSREEKDHADIGEAQRTLADSLQSLAHSTVDAPLTRKEFDGAAGARDAMIGASASRRSAYRGYLSFLFHAQSRRALAHHLPGLPDLLRESVGTAAANEARPYDVVTFSHYATQPIGYHPLRDRLDLVTDHPDMHRRMLNECAELMTLFRGHLLSPNAEEDRPRFLRSVLDALAKGAFRLTPERAAKRTGYDYR